MNLEFDPNAEEDLLFWIKNNKKKATKIRDLIKETLQTPYTGTGKPEPLKHNFSSCWSRRIDKEHRLVYKIEKDTLIILACRYHYKS